MKKFIFRAEFSDGEVFETLTTSVGIDDVVNMFSIFLDGATFSKETISDGMERWVDNNKL